MSIKDFFFGKSVPRSEYSSMDIVEIRGAKIFIAVTAVNSAIGLTFQFIAGHRITVLLPTIVLYGFAIYFAYRVYKRKKRGANPIVYALIVAVIMFSIPIIARFNYAFTINWFYAAQSNHINWLLAANLVAFQFLYNKRLFRSMSFVVIISIIAFYILAWLNGVDMPFATYTGGKVNYGVLSSREIFSILMLFVIAYLSYRNIIETEALYELATNQQKIIKEYADEQSRFAEEIQSQYEELEAQYEEIEQMNEEMAASQNEIMAMNISLQKEKERLYKTITVLAPGIIEVDSSFGIELINESARKILLIGSSDVRLKDIRSILVVKDSDGNAVNLAGSDIISGSKFFDLYNPLIFSAGDDKRSLTLRVSPLAIDGNIYGYVFVIEDVTEIKRMKEHLINSSKLESLGIFAGGIAHDINNFFTGMLGAVALSKKNLYSDPSIALKYLEDAEYSALRARNLAEQLLTFSKGGEPVKKLISLPDLIKRSSEFALSGSKIKTNFEIDDNVKIVNADESQISQVLNNILINSAQLMSEGNIYVRCKNISLKADNDYGVVPGDYVEISIEDEGPGIPEKFLGKIFDPFFSTKPSGSGLGLSVVYSVIKRHNGSILALNTARGAMFKFVLPASESYFESNVLACKSGQCYSGRVIIMDDDEMIRMVAEEIIKSFGFETYTASEGREAVEIFRKLHESGLKVDFVLLDLTIRGGMGGNEAFQLMRGIDPMLKGIVSSGYSHDTVMSNYRDYGFIAVLKKPYNIDEIGEVIASVMAG